MRLSFFDGGDDLRHEARSRFIASISEEVKAQIAFIIFVFDYANREFIIRNARMKVL